MKRHGLIILLTAASAFFLLALSGCARGIMKTEHEETAAIGREEQVKDKAPIAEPETAEYHSGPFYDYYDAETGEFVVCEFPEQDNNIEAPSDIPKTEEEQRTLDRNLSVLAEAAGDESAAVINDRILAYYRKGDIASLEVVGTVEREYWDRITEYEVTTADGKAYEFEFCYGRLASIKEKAVRQFKDYIYVSEHYYGDSVDEKHDNNIVAPSDMPKMEEEQQILDRNIPLLEAAAGKIRASIINGRIFAYYRTGDISALEVAEAKKREYGQNVCFEVGMMDGSRYELGFCNSFVLVYIKEKSVRRSDYAKYIYIKEKY